MPKKLFLKWLNCRKEAHQFWKNWSKSQKKQGLVNVKRLIQDVSTRWNSTFEMFRRFLELKGPVEELLTESCISSKVGVVDSTTWQALHEAMEVL